MKSKERIVYITGCFDLLHVGHIRLLKKSKKLGDKLVVAIADDAYISKTKGSHRPIIKQAARKEMLEALSFVDSVAIQKNREEAIRYAKKIGVTHLILSDREKHRLKEKDELAEAYKKAIPNIKIIFLWSHAPTYSTSKIESKIQKTAKAKLLKK